jgi:O-antigen ligase
MSKRFEQVILIGLVLAVLFTALTHGAVETWSLVLFEFVVILLLGLWGLKAVLDKQLQLRFPSVFFPLAVLLLLGLAQSIVLTNSAGQRQSLSLDVEATRHTTTVLFFMIVALLLATQVLADRRYLQRVPMFVAGYGLVMAIFGLVQHFSWDGKFYWWRQTTDIVTSPFGPFVTHNHFAGYMEMLLPIPIALVIMRAGRIEVRLFYVFAAAMMAGSALASLSRGGFISLLAQLIFLAAAIPFLPRKTRHSHSRPSKEAIIDGDAVIPVAKFTPAKIASPVAAILVITLAIGVSIYWIGLEPVFSRLAQGQIVGDDPQKETFFVSRGWIWRDTYTMIKAHPVTGVGLGAYETAFPIYSQSDGSLVVSQAHNDYLQIVAEVGPLGLILVVWFIVIALRQTFHGLRLRDPLLAGLALGSGASLVGMMVHSIFDFNLQLPSHALLLMMLTAVLSQVSVRDVRPAVEMVREPESPHQAYVSSIGSYKGRSL